MYAIQLNEIWLHLKIRSRRPLPLFSFAISIGVILNSFQKDTSYDNIGITVKVNGIFQLIQIILSNMFFTVETGAFLASSLCNEFTPAQYSSFLGKFTNLKYNFPLGFSHHFNLIKIIELLIISRRF